MLRVLSHRVRDSRRGQFPEGIASRRERKQRAFLSIVIQQVVAGQLEPAYRVGKIYTWYSLLGSSSVFISFLLSICLGVPVLFVEAVFRGSYPVFVQRLFLRGFYHLCQGFL